METHIRNQVESSKPQKALGNPIWNKINFGILKKRDHFWSLNKKVSEKRQSEFANVSEKLVIGQMWDSRIYMYFQYLIE